MLAGTEDSQEIFMRMKVILSMEQEIMLKDESSNLLEQDILVVGRGYTLTMTLPQKLITVASIYLGTKVVALHACQTWDMSVG